MAVDVLLMVCFYIFLLLQKKKNW